MYLFRIHIRPYGGSADIPATFDYCLKNGILGVGWRVDGQENTEDWDAFLREASRVHTDLNVCKYIKKWVSAGDLVWTRNALGAYYLARVLSGWEYWTSIESQSCDIDIANVFRVKMFAVELDAVPGKVVACFRAQRTMQEIADPKVLEYSKFLWNKISGGLDYEIDRSKFPDIFAMLDAEETEDLVFLYLQMQGWYIIPNSRKADTMSFEYLAVNPQTGRKALAQVKTGHSSLVPNDYREFALQVFLFQSNELYIGDVPQNVVCIPRSELLAVLNAARSWLPTTFLSKIDLVEHS